MQRSASDAIGNMALSYRYVVARIPTGCDPQHLALSPDGRRLFVAERLDDRVLVVDTASLKPVGRIVLGDGGLDDPIRHGRAGLHAGALHVPRAILLPLVPPGRPRGRALL